MGTLLPPKANCSFDAAGEGRFADILIHKLPDDFLCWYNVPVGRQRLRPDFVVLHPQAGLLVLEVKDWLLKTIQHIDPLNAAIIDADGRLKNVVNPLEQARQYLFTVVDELSRDKQLVSAEGQYKGKLLFPYGHGLVLTKIKRKEFESTDLREVLPPHLVICEDEMANAVDPDRFRDRLTGMFAHRFPHQLSVPQIDRIRWTLFPDVRIGTQAELFASDADMEIPDLLRVMDLQQEQLARSLGDGHRIIHGVAGSGKTLILGYRAEHLAQACNKPILVLCYNKALAAKLSSMMDAKQLSRKVNVTNFHKWVFRELRAYNIPLPPEPVDGSKDAFYEECVNLLIKSVDAKHVPAGQYDALLIDEGHDFKPEWLKLVVQMIHPHSRSLLVLFDDAQSIYEGPKKRRFTFASVGIEARGRTTILKLNYRNTAEILAVARAFAQDLLKSHQNAEDEAPLVQPISAGRHGPVPLLVDLPSAGKEADFVAERLEAGHKTGIAWMDMAVVYHYRHAGERIAEALKRRRIPTDAQQLSNGVFDPAQDSVKLVTMHSSKGLEFPLVCIPGLDGMPDKRLDAAEQARLLYVAMTRATHELVLTHVGESAFTARVREALAAAA